MERKLIKFYHFQVFLFWKISLVRKTNFTMKQSNFSPEPSSEFAITNVHDLDLGDVCYDG